MKNPKFPLLLNLVPTIAASILFGSQMSHLEPVVDDELQKGGFLVKPHDPAEFVMKHFAVPDTLRDKGVKEYDLQFVSDPSLIFGELEDSYLMDSQIQLSPRQSGEIIISGWSGPEPDLKKAQHLLRNGVHARKFEAKAGEQLIMDTSGLRPGVYRIYFVSGDRALAVQELQLTYPDDYAFKLEDPLFFGIKHVWNDWSGARPWNAHYSMVVINGGDHWNNIHLERGQYNFSRVDELLEEAKRIQKPIIYKINGPAPEWLFDYVAHVGGNTPEGGKTRGGEKAPQFWAPMHRTLHKEMIDALAEHVENHPLRRWFLGIRVQPNAFNTEAWHYSFNGREMEMNGIIPDRSTWIPPRKEGYDIYPAKLEADNFAEARAYLRDIIRQYEGAFHPIGIYCFLRPYLETDHGLGMDLSKNYDKELTAPMGTDATAHTRKPATIRGQLFKHYARDRRQPAFHEDTYGSFRGERWSEAHGRTMNYDVSPRYPEQEIYWRQPLKLYEGVTMSAWGSIEFRDTEGPGYQAARDLFIRYAGGEMYPGEARYAWLIFSEYRAQSHVRNISYWMEERSSSGSEILNNPSTDYRGFMLAGFSGGAIELELDSKFYELNKGKPVRVRVEWLGDSDDDAWAILFDGERYEQKITPAGGFQTEVLWLQSLPREISFKKLEGAPKFHRIEVEVL